MMKTLLISFLSEIRNFGVLYISSYLEKYGHENTILFLPLYKKESYSETSSILEFIEHNPADLIGMSIMSFSLNEAIYLTKKIKEKWPNKMVLWGGIHPTITPETCIEEADAICIGEGEEPMLEFVEKFGDGKDYTNVDSFWVKTNERVIKNEIRPPVQELDKLPFPKYISNNFWVLDGENVRKLTDKLYQKYMHWNGQLYDIIATRGCPYNCSYCCNNVFHKIYRGKGKIMRRRSIKNIIEELSYATHTFDFVNTIDIQDDSFLSASIGWIEEFASSYNEKIKLPFYCRACPTYVIDEKVAILKEVGLTHVQMGLEGNERINYEIYNRCVKEEKFLEATKILHKYGIIQHYDVILGNPYAKETDILALIDTLLKIRRPFWINAFHLVFYPGTLLYKRALRDGIISPDYNRYFNYYFTPRDKISFLEELIINLSVIPIPLMRFFINRRNSPLTRRIFKIYKNTYIKVFMQIADKLINHEKFFTAIRPFYLNLMQLFTKSSKIPAKKI